MSVIRFIFVLVSAWPCHQDPLGLFVDTFSTVQPHTLIILTLYTQAFDVSFLILQDTNKINVMWVCAASYHFWEFKNKSLTSQYFLTSKKSLWKAKFLRNVISGFNKSNFLLKILNHLCKYFLTSLYTKRWWFQTNVHLFNNHFFSETSSGMT